MKRALAIAFALAAAAACKRAADRPVFTGDLVPPQLAKLGIVMGASTEADVTAKLPGATVSKDSSFGGTGLVKLDDQPAIDVETNGAQVWLVGNPPVAVQLAMHADGICDFVKDKLVPLNAPRACGASNRKTEKGTLEMCFSTPQGQPLALACQLSCAVAAGQHSQCLTLRVR